MRGNGLMGSFYYASEWVIRLLITNLLWILFNLPSISLAINLVAVENMNELLMAMITIALLMSFIFFPATTAMFAVTRK